MFCPFCHARKYLITQFQSFEKQIKKSPKNSVLVGFEFAIPMPEKWGGLSALKYLISHDRTGERDAFGGEFGFINHHVDRVEDVWRLNSSHVERKCEFAEKRVLALR